MEPPIRIVLVRHGETEWNRTRRFQGRRDVPLNRTGEAQAQALARVLRDEPLAAVYSSPLTRALETARIIHRLHPGIPLRMETGLVEMDLGSFDGMDGRQWATDHPEFLRAWQQDPSRVRMPGGETLEEVQDRALATLDRIVGCHEAGDGLLICSHNFVNLAILCHALEIPLARFRTVRQGNGSLNRLYREEGRLRAEVVDDRSHLQDDLALEA